MTFGELYGRVVAEVPTFESKGELRRTVNRVIHQINSAFPAEERLEIACERVSSVDIFHDGYGFNWGEDIEDINIDIEELNIRVEEGIYPDLDIIYFPKYVKELLAVVIEEEEWTRVSYEKVAANAGYNYYFLPHPGAIGFEGTTISGTTDIEVIIKYTKAFETLKIPAYVETSPTVGFPNAEHVEDLSEVEIDIPYRLDDVLVSGVLYCLYSLPKHKNPDLLTMNKELYYSGLQNVAMREIGRTPTTELDRKYTY